MGITRQKAHGRAPRALATTLALAVLAAVLLAGAAVAAGHEGTGKGAAKPGAPRAKAPKATIATTTPTFTWTKARGAASYELRVYQGRKQLLEKTGLGKNRRSWKSSMALPANVDLTRKVRARRSAGAWSKSLKFKVVPPSPEKAITALSFSSPAATGVINEALHTIAVAVPFGTDVTALVATFITSGAPVATAGKPQTSGLTANNFSNPVTYTVTAADASTQADVVTGATARGLGAGSANTTAIIAAQGGTPATFAEGLVRAYTGGGCTDWYFPSKEELNGLYALKVLGFGALGSGTCWSSSEISATGTWTQSFGDRHQYGSVKSTTLRVRAVRSL